MNDDYIQRRRNRQRTFLRIRFGISQMIHKPLLNVLFLPIVAGTVFLWMKKCVIYTLFDVPHFMIPIYQYAIVALFIILPVVCVFTVITVIANVLAQKDEADLQNAFNSQELRNGCPILMSKKRIRGSNVIRREFYSNIPMRIWVERQEDIADAMNVHFVEKLTHGVNANGKRIVMYTASGRESTSKEEMYDDDL